MQFAMTLWLCTACAVSAAGAELHVSPTAAPGGTGAKDKPFATLTQARDAIRALKKQGGLPKGGVTVWLHDGTFTLTEPFVLTSEDSGTAEAPITYAAFKDAKPVISGGRMITGWKRGKGDIWTTTVPGVKEGKWYFRHLFVDGRRAVRARTPNRDAAGPEWQLVGADLTNDLSRYTLTLPKDALAAWSNPTDIEVMVAGHWAINRLPVQSIDPGAGVITLRPPHARGHDAIRPSRGRWSYVENARELLDQPGEWYLDGKTGILHYWPLPDQDMTKIEVIAPVLGKLIVVGGSVDNPIRHVHFKGLDLVHTTLPLREVGYMGVQACHHVIGKDWETRKWGRLPAAISWVHVQQSSLEDCRIAHQAGCGIELVEGCEDNLIQGNEITDISGNGIMVGCSRDEGAVPRRNRVANNHVHNCGAEYYGGVGIWVGFAQQTAVAHNWVHDLPYSGISVGWQWNNKPTSCKENVIEYNHVHNVMKRLADGGAIYTLGLQPGTVIRGNHLHDVYRSRRAEGSANNGMFIDEGSTGFLFEDNLIYNTSAGAVRFNANRKEGHTWRNNYFTNSAPIRVAGRIGNAFRGIQMVPHAPELEPEKLTLECWVQLAGFPDDSDPRRWLVGKNANEWAQGHYGLLVIGDAVGAYLNIGGGRENEYSVKSASGLLKVGTWYHLAMTYDGQVLRAFLDGREVASKEIGKKRQPGTGPFAIGQRPDKYVPAVDGSIDDVRLYNRLIPIEELKAHAEKPVAITDPSSIPGLVGYWSFDEKAETNDDMEKIKAKAGLEPQYRAVLESERPARAE